MKANYLPSGLLFLSLRELTAHPVRTGVGVISVMMGVATLIAMNGLTQSILSALGGGTDVQILYSGLSGQLEGMLLSAGILVSLAAGFVLFNIFGMAVAARRQQIGMLRALGMTRGQILQLTLTEALITGGIGVLLGALIGQPLGQAIVNVLKNIDSPLNAFAEAIPKPAIYLLAVGLGLAITALSMLIPARQAASISPLEALRESMRPGRTNYAGRWRRWIGVVLLIALALWLLIDPPARWVQAPVDGQITAAVSLSFLVAIGLLMPDAPALMSRLVRPLPGAAVRLISDNLLRARTRVALTAATMAVVVGLVVALTGFMGFYINQLFGPSFTRMASVSGQALSTFDLSGGLSSVASMDDLALPPASITAIKEAVGDQAAVMPTYYVVVPELAFLMKGYFSMMMDADGLARTGDAMFEFKLGDWAHALPILKKGCGLLISPMVASTARVGLYDTLTVTGKDGPVDCKVAGIGQPMAGASLMGDSAREQFITSSALAMAIFPDADVRASPARMQATTQAIERVAKDYHLFTMPLDFLNTKIQEAFGVITNLLNGVLLLAAISGALGVINTTVTSIAERQRELGLLRAVGATRRMALMVVMGEAALIGLTGALVGVLAGLGLTVISPLAYGGNAFGLIDFDPYASAITAVGPTLTVALVGLISTPLISALAAWLPARAALRGMPIETLGRGRE
jgi:putative ABC transport system permease protein